MTLSPSIGESKHRSEANLVLQTKTTGAKSSASRIAKVRLIYNPKFMWKTTLGCYWAVGRDCPFPDLQNAKINETLVLLWRAARKPNLAGAF